MNSVAVSITNQIVPPHIFNTVFIENATNVASATVGIAHPVLIVPLPLAPIVAPKNIRREKPVSETVTARYLDNLLLRSENYTKRTGRHPPIYCYAPISTCEPLGQKRARGRPSKATRNDLKVYLQNYMTAKQALDALPMLDDIVTGAVQLDLGGNTRALNKKLMIEMLQRIDIITAEVVQEWMQGSLRHAQKIATCLRTIVMLAKRVAGSWPAPVDECGHWVD
jgi:hypothetical protein